MQNNSKTIQKLTSKEEEIMNLFWEKGDLFVRELLNFYDDPKPHFNTLSTIVRGLEEKNFLGHKSFGNSYQYLPLLSREDYKKGALQNVVNKYFKNSYLGVVSSLIEEEEVSLEELKRLIEKVEKSAKSV